MKAVLIFMVCASFLVAILTAGRENKPGYVDNGPDQRNDVR